MQTRVTLYFAQPGTPAAIPNFIDPGAGCSWWGVGGQVFNESGRPEPGLIVRVAGTVEGRAYNQTAISGGSLGFGAGGFDLKLADHLPYAASLSMQVFDAAGRTQSAQIPLPVYTSCTQNLVVMNLRQRTYDLRIFFPFLKR